MHSAMPVATGEKSILLLAYVHRKNYTGYGHHLKYAWFIIKHAVDGRPQIFKTFNHKLQTSEEYEDCQSNNLGLSYALIGSSFYVIGDSLSYHGQWYDGINSLDTRNFYDGWKNHILPFRCEGTVTAVHGDFIYIFPGEQPFRVDDLKEYEDKDGRRGYVYDTKNQRSYMIGRIPSRSPPKNGWHRIRAYAALNEPNMWGLLVAVEEDEDFYLHDPLMNKWTICKEYDPLPKLSVIFEDSYRHVTERSFTTLNGKLYILDLLRKSQTRIHIYDVVNGKLLFSDYISEFDDLSYGDYEVHLVPVADDMICFLWYNESANMGWKGTKRPVIHYLKVRFSYDPAITFDVVDRTGFQLDICEILSCQPFDPSPDQVEEIASPPPKQTVVNVFDDDDMEEDSWRFVNSRVLVLATETETNDVDLYKAYRNQYY